VVNDEALGKTILEIEVRGKHGVGYCKSMPVQCGPLSEFEAGFAQRIYGVNTSRPTLGPQLIG
jgi:hypothetical protein